MRAGWMRPSVMSLVSVRRAVSRRTPSKPESTTASGVSSMMKSMPVMFSSVRMLRPSRPMMRPFMSSDGRLTTETVVSATWLAAVRWMLSERMLRARRSASLRASSSICRTSLAISWRASSSVCLSSISLACAALRPEMRSSWIIASACALFSSSDMRWLLASRSRMDCSRRSCSAPRASMASSRCSWRCSALVSSSRRSRSSASTSLRTRCTSSLASRRASLTMVSASRRESLRSFSASRSAPASLLEARLRRMKYPTAMPTARPTTMYTAIIILSIPSQVARHKKRPGNAPGLCHARTCTTIRWSSCDYAQGSGRLKVRKTSQISHR